MKPLHDLLRKRRLELGLSQGDVAARLADVVGERRAPSQAHVSRMEIGNRRVPGDLLAAFAQVLGLSETELLSIDSRKWTVPCDVLLDLGRGPLVIDWVRRNRKLKVVSESGEVLTELRKPG